jgi:uncharacterized protein
MVHFAPLTATIGGLLIGLAATLLWALNGRTAGVSSIFGGLYPADRGDVLWRIVFLVGLPVGGLLGFWLGPLLFSEIPTLRPSLDLGLPGLIVAGLLVGAGTRIGRGCTSGHGICGLARLSPRSFVAVATFMGAGMITVFVMRHVIG